MAKKLNSSVKKNKKINNSPQKKGSKKKLSLLIWSLFNFKRSMFIKLTIAKITILVLLFLVCRRYFI